jgi:hypothetical protein
MNEKHSTTMNLSIMVLGIIGIFSALISHDSLLAQEPYEPVYESLAGIVNVSWSSDGATLTFQEAFPLEGGVPDIGVQSIRFDTWRQYQIDAGVLPSQRAWPQQITNEGLQAEIELATSREGKPSFTFPSPDNRYLIYAAPQPAGWDGPGWPLAISNVREGTHVLLEDIVTVSLINFGTAYNVTWSADSTAFTIQAITINSQRQTYYVTGFSEEIGRIRSICLCEGISVNGEVRYPYSAYDISADGSSVVLEDVTNGTERRLFVWDAQNPAQSQTIGQGNQYIAAAFSLEENSVLYISLDGLVEYNLENGSTRVMDAAISSRWADEAFFSPDLSQIALINTSHLGASILYVVGI